MVVLSPETLMSILQIDEEALDCAGLKLHLDKVFKLKSLGRLTASSRELPEIEEISPVDGFFKLEAGAYRIRYREYVRVPPNAIAIALPRSTLIRMGATIFTAVWDPGYEGRGEGLLAVFNPFGVELEAGAQVAQLVFVSMDRETKKLYRGAYYRENI